MSRRKPRPMAHCLGAPSPRLSRLLRRADQHRREQADFDAALPAALRGVCRLAGQRDGKVLLHVDSSAWATRLRYQLPELTETSKLLREASKVQVKVRPPVHVVEPAPRPPARLSPRSAQLLAEFSEHVEDPGLAAALRRLATRSR